MRITSYPHVLLNMLAAAIGRSPAEFVVFPKAARRAGLCLSRCLMPDDSIIFSVLQVLRMIAENQAHSIGSLSDLGGLHGSFGAIKARLCLDNSYQRLL